MNYTMATGSVTNMNYTITAHVMGEDTYDVDAPTREAAIEMIENNEVEPRTSVIGETVSYTEWVAVRRDGNTTMEAREVTS